MSLSRKLWLPQARCPFWTPTDTCPRSLIQSSLRSYKKFGSPSQLSQLNDFDLRDSGIEDSGDRKLILAAFRKAGYAQRPSPVKRKKIEDSEHNSHLGTSSANLAAPGPSSAPTVRLSNAASCLKLSQIRPIRLGPRSASELRQAS